MTDAEKAVTRLGDWFVRKGEFMGSMSPEWQAFGEDLALVLLVAKDAVREQPTAYEKAEKIVDRVAQAIDKQLERSFRGFPDTLSRQTSDYIREEVDEAIVELKRDLKTELCVHEWVDPTNEYVEPGSELCLKCGMIRRTDGAGRSIPTETLSRDSGDTPESL